MIEFLKSSSFSILVNGSLKVFFLDTRELHQGDPLSPFLFVVVEALSKMMYVAANARLIKGLCPSSERRK